jgi:hypothetical protein
MSRSILATAALLGVLLIAGGCAPESQGLPGPVSSAFRGAFPNAQIQKQEVEQEHGVSVYDLEFRNGAIEQEADIAADGTILEVTRVIDVKEVPAPAMKAIEKATGGAKIKRIEHIEISFRAKDGKVIKLDKPVVRYAAEYSKAGKTREVVVTPEGAVIKEEEEDEEE